MVGWLALQEVWEYEYDSSITIHYLVPQLSLSTDENTVSHREGVAATDNRASERTVKMMKMVNFSLKISQFECPS